MEISAYILSIDQGTTGTTAILWDEKGAFQGRAYREHRQYYPQPGWVEHDPEEIWAMTLAAVEDLLRETGRSVKDLAAIGITNQRETVVFWDRETGKTLGNAIVWQCRRTASLCQELKERGWEEKFRRKTGLLLDPYFTGTKVRWALEHWPAVQEAAREGRLACGTIDSYLLYRLTGGKVHATDYSNASRTLLFNIHTLAWDEELLELLQVPAEALPQVLPSSHLFGETDPQVFFGAAVPIGGIAGDQQAALFGQACFQPGMTKNTYGTGSFLLMNTGTKAVASSSGLLTTVAWGVEGKVEYALEGSIFITGAAVQWLRDGLGLIEKASDLEPLALTVEDNGGVYLVPAFVGLGAPYWDPYARGIIIGITRGTTRGHLARAVVEAMAYQTRDVLDLMRRESGLPLEELRVDGGASVMDLLLQFQADLAGTVVRRGASSETTALGAAYLAGLTVGLWPDRETLAGLWQESASFQPRMSAEERERCYRNWRRAAERSLGWIEKE
ncbi:MAG TPA: glycerol kinase GlpK [Bacillota bacterium]|jgi:glycerol kinase|nr:glycerol kinase GlpK [Bacillota bacterium]HOB86734.1 glycerol kinase GlpK [Bacillota bacterium]HOP69106.1 glycerol kinase GlpK [Bacillota bacterium]HPT33621.1 glycerol kinase GlpK [Bacillota bacterium]HPZ65684.1 glycerol kinase GlpK [Bacillota bacterium]